jgi:tetratricopeptide (TPR) repeat protein
MGMRKAAVIPIAIALAAVLLSSGCYKLEARIELNKGNTFFKNEKFKDALIQFERGVKLDPSLTFAWRSVALTAMTLYHPGSDDPENKRYLQTAIDAFKRYLAAFPQDQKAQDFLIATYANAGMFDEVLKYLQADLAKHPGDLRSNRSIVQLYLRTQRIKEAYDWIENHIPNKDSEAYYLVGVYCWDKAYRDPTISLQVRGEFTDLGLTAEAKALKVQSEYFEAMVYTNLLYREKAKQQTDEKLKQQYFDKAEEWRTNAMALREKLKKRPALAQS